MTHVVPLFRYYSLRNFLQQQQQNKHAFGVYNQTLKLNERYYCQK